MEKIHENRAQKIKELFAEYQTLEEKIYYLLLQ
jgi:hypothetical protein